MGAEVTIICATFLASEVIKQLTDKDNELDNYRLNYEPALKCPNSFGGKLLDGEQKHLGIAYTIQNCMQLVTANSESNMVYYNPYTTNCFSVNDNKLIEIEKSYHFPQVCVLDQTYPRPAFLSNYTNLINIAITGNSGVGKSTFINTVRNMKPTDNGGADVSPTECTREPTPYSFNLDGDGSERLFFWDLPGAGTPTFPINTYIQNMGLRYFDAVLFLNADRFRETDKMIATELKNAYVPHYFVKTKANIDFKNNEDDFDRSPLETKEMITKELKTNGIDKVFFVGKYVRGKTDPYNQYYDYRSLLTHLLCNLYQHRNSPSMWEWMEKTSQLLKIKITCQETYAA